MRIREKDGTRNRDALSAPDEARLRAAMMSVPRRRALARFGLARDRRRVGHKGCDREQEQAFVIPDFHAKVLALRQEGGIGGHALAGEPYRIEARLVRVGQFHPIAVVKRGPVFGVEEISRHRVKNANAAAGVPEKRKILTYVPTIPGYSPEVLVDS